MDLLEFIGSLILSEGEGIHLGLDVFGLSLLQAALNTGAQALARCAATSVHAASGPFLGDLPSVQLTAQDLKSHHWSKLSFRVARVLLLGSIIQHSGRVEIFVPAQYMASSAESVTAGMKLCCFCCGKTSGEHWQWLLADQILQHSHMHARYAA